MRDKESFPFVPIVVTLIAGILWAIFMLLHVLFWSSGFDWFQNILIFILSLVIAGCIIGLMWVYWVFRRA